jgi:hypothetical protein
MGVDMRAWGLAGSAAIGLVGATPALAGAGGWLVSGPQIFLLLLLMLLAGLLGYYLCKRRHGR